jgi:hypothetical protein
VAMCGHDNAAKKTVQLSVHEINSPLFISGDSSIPCDVIISETARPRSDVAICWLVLHVSEVFY